MAEEACPEQPEAGYYDLVSYRILLSMMPNTSKAQCYYAVLPHEIARTHCLWQGWMAKWPCYCKVHR